MRYKIEATIPTTQYGNIRPSFEIEDATDENVALDTLKHLWQRYGETPLKDKSGGGVVVKSFTGEELLYNEETHTYLDLKGNRLVSGSQYAESISPKFDLGLMLPKTAKSWDVSEEELREIWRKNSDISTHWGSAIHDALELYHKSKATGDKIKAKKELEDNYVLPKNQFLKKVILDFEEQFGLDGEPEVLISDVSNGRAGRIDRLTILDKDKKVCRIGDYKTNVDLDEKKMLKYQHQLSFYAAILQAKEWTVEGLDLYHFSDGWTHHVLDILPLTKK